jgi:hypothetical protein
MSNRAGLQFQLLRASNSNGLSMMAEKAWIVYETRRLHSSAKRKAMMSLIAIFRQLTLGQEFASLALGQIYGCAVMEARCPVVVFQ